MCHPQLQVERCLGAVTSTLAQRSAVRRLQQVAWVSGEEVVHSPV